MASKLCLTIWDPDNLVQCSAVQCSVALLLIRLVRCEAAGHKLAASMTSRPALVR